MTTVDQNAMLDLDSSWIKKFLLRFVSSQITDDEMCDTMRKVLDKFKYFADPHTSVAWPPFTWVCLVLFWQPRHHANFEESVTVALGEKGWKEYKEEFFPASAAEPVTKERSPQSSTSSWMVNPFRNPTR
jgi:hypothetical protein